MTDLGPRINRLKEIATSLYGSVLSVDGDVAEAEVPADLSGAFSFSLGQGGFSGFIHGQNVRQAPKRIVDMDSRIIVCDEMTTQAYYVYRIELQDRHARVFNPADPLAAHPSVAAITRPTGKP